MNKIIIIIFPNQEIWDNSKLLGIGIEREKLELSFQPNLELGQFFNIDSNTIGQ